MSLWLRASGRSLALACALLSAAAPAHAQSVASLFTSLPSDFAHLFTPANGIIAGAGGAASLVARPNDRDIARHIYAPSGGRHDLFHAGATIGDGTTQGAIALGAYLAGRTSHHARLAALGADLVDAQIVNGVLTQGLKTAVDRARPTGSAHSFPSGHTSATFATAAVIQEHYGWKVGAPFYALGGYVSVSRLVDNQHWMSDVLFGAALGIVSGRAASLGTGSHRIVVSPALLPRGFAIAGSVGRRGRP
jgi:membrane-associated phospholipid phosphatase